MKVQFPAEPQAEPRLNIELKASEVESGKSPVELILCPHCQRTTKNRIKCQGICVADSGY